MQFNSPRVGNTMHAYIMIKRKFSLHFSQLGSHLDKQIIAKCDKCKEEKAHRNCLKSDWLLQLSMSVMTSWETDMWSGTYE